MFIVGSAIGPPTPEELNVDSDLQWRQPAKRRLSLTIEVGESMDPHVTSVRALDYELEVSFENGERRLFDVKPYLSRGIFARLQDRSLFQAACAVAGSVEWPGGLDLSYDMLILRVSRLTSKARTRPGPQLLETPVTAEGHARPMAHGLVELCAETITQERLRHLVKTSQ